MIASPLNNRAVDLYFILQQAPLDKLMAQVAQIDPGFDLYWFAVALNRAGDFPDEQSNVR
jgi:hypothetical protein